MTKQTKRRATRARTAPPAAATVAKAADANQADEHPQGQSARQAPEISVRHAYGVAIVPIREDESDLDMRAPQDVPLIPVSPLDIGDSATHCGVYVENQLMGGAFPTTDAARGILMDALAGDRPRRPGRGRDWRRTHAVSAINDPRGPLIVAMNSLLRGLASLALSDILSGMLSAAAEAAIDAAAVMAINAAASRPADEWIARVLPNNIARVGADTRKAIVSTHIAKMRDLLDAALFDSNERDLIRRAGRAAETQRDHRAYCMREWLMRSEDSEFAHVPSNLRGKDVKKKVLQQIKGLPIKQHRVEGKPEPEDTMHNGTWGGIIRRGKAEHLRVSPGVAFCGPSLWRDDGA